MRNLILHHLEAIIESGSVIGACRRLFLSQPALSQYIKRLEVTEYVNSTTGLKYVVGHSVSEFFLTGSFGRDIAFLQVRKSLEVDGRRGASS